MAMQTPAWLFFAQVLSGAVVVQGELEAVVTATGANTFFGRTISLLNAPEGKGHLQKVRILTMSLLATLALSAIEHNAKKNLLNLDYDTSTDLYPQRSP